MEPGEPQDSGRGRRPDGNRGGRPAAPAPGGGGRGQGGQYARRGPGPAPASVPPEPWAGPPRPDEGRRKKGSPAARYAGWGDGIERVACARLSHTPPPGFPVTPRPGVATLPLRHVAVRPDAVLLCDDSHTGPHLWADWDPATDEERGASPGREPVNDPRAAEQERRNPDPAVAEAGAPQGS